MGAGDRVVEPLAIGIPGIRIGDVRAVVCGVEAMVALWCATAATEFGIRYNVPNTGRY